MAEAYFEDPLAQELARAVSAGSTSRIREAVEKGAALDATGRGDITMLEWAVYAQQPDALKTLVELGADVTQPGIGGGTVVHLAAMVADARYLRVLLDAGVDPDLPHSRDRRTPLMEAVHPHSAAHLQMLLAAGADVNLSDRTGKTPLHRAALVNGIDHVLTLLRAGADPEAVTDRGATFQAYFWSADADLLHEQALDARRQVAEWLQVHDVPLHEDARWTRNGR